MRIPLFNDKVVKKYLPNYLKIDRNEIAAKFQIAKRIKANFDSSMDIQDLMKIHSKLVKKIKYKKFEKRYTRKIFA